MKKVFLFYLLLAPFVFSQGLSKFEVVNIYIDSQENALVAYQIELTYDEDIEIVSIEAGQTKAFTHAPFYQKTPKNKGKLVLASFTTKDEIAPKGMNKFCSIHIRYTGKNELRIKTLVKAAAKAGGEKIPIKVILKTQDNKTISF